jgi:glycine/D-amino acid oxidase-like deaminating enzyme
MRQEGSPKTRRRILVVGAGLTGASLAWLAAKRGHEVTVVSSDRPASQATALAPGLVHGFGLPGGLAEWTELRDEDGLRAAGRDRLGYDLLRDVVLASRRPTGFLRCPHLVVADTDLAEERVDRAAGRLRELGFPVERREHGGSSALVREDDALVDPRRLTFELLHRARASGARVQLGVACLGLRRRAEGGVAASTTAGELETDEAYWAAGRFVPGEPIPSKLTVRIVLHQTLAPGREPLEEILECADGAAILAPHPSRRMHTVLARVAEETVAGGLQWPEPPPAWDVHRGPAIRQLLSEAVTGPPGTHLGAPGPIRSMVGFSGWPVATLLGACAESLDEPPKPI